MSNDDQQDHVTPEEMELLRELRTNPIMESRIHALMKQYRDEITKGMDAHEAELSIIEALRQLGTSMLSQWAQHTEEQAISEDRHSHPDLQKHTKKNSGGTAPSEK